MAVERISTLLDRLSQGGLEHDELDKLLKDATTPLDSTEEQYLYEVIANLYPNIPLPSAANSTSTTADSSSHQPLKIRKALADRTNKPEEQQQSCTPVQDTSTSKLLTQDFNSRSITSEEPAWSAALNEHTGLLSSWALLQQGPAAITPAVPLLASTDQLAALVTAATTAATRAVARTILHHSRTGKGHQQGNTTAAGAAQQQAAISSRFQAHVVQPPETAETVAEESVKQHEDEEVEQPRKLLPTQQLLKFASVSQGPAAGAWHLRHRTLPAAAPHPAAAPDTVITGTVEQHSSGSNAGPIVKYPRIWVRPDEQQVEQQQEQQSDQLCQPVKSSSAVSSKPVVQQQQQRTKQAAQPQLQQQAAALDRASSPGQYQQHSLRRRRTSGSGSAPQAKTSAAVQADTLTTADEAVQVDVGAPTSGQQQGHATVQQQQQEEPIDHWKPQLQQQQQSSVSSQQQQQQQQLPEQAEGPASPTQPAQQQQQQPADVPLQQQQQPGTPVVPSPVPLPPELRTAVQRTLQTFKEPLVQQYPAASKAMWQQQPDETARAVYHMLGSTFDYTAAANQLSQVAAAAQQLATAGKGSSTSAGRIHISSSPVGTLAIRPGQQGGAGTDAASTQAAAAANAWPAVLGDVLPPLTMFYEHEDAWQDVERFGQAVERDIAWRLAAPAGHPTNTRSASSRSVTFASTPVKAAVGTPVKAPPAAAANLAAAAAAQGTPGRATASTAGEPCMADSKSPAKRRLQLEQSAAAPSSPAAASSAAPVAAAPRLPKATPHITPAASVDRPKPRAVVAFGRRVDKPLPAPSLSSRSFAISPSSRVTAAVRAATGLQPAYELPRFVDHSSAGAAARDTRPAAAAGVAGRASRAAATLTALQRLAQRRRAAAAAAFGDGVSGWQEPSPETPPAAAADGDVDVLDVLLEALLESQQQQQQDEEAAAHHEQQPQQAFDIESLPHQVADAEQDQIQQLHQQQPGIAPQFNLGRSSGRQFAAVYDLSEPYVPFLSAAGPAAAAAALQQQLHFADPQAVSKHTLQQTWQQQQQHETAEAPHLEPAATEPVAVQQAGEIYPVAAAAGGGGSGNIVAIPAGVKQEVLSVLLDEVMADLLQQQQTAVGAGPAAVGFGTQALNQQALRELVAQELSAAMDALLAEELSAAAAAEHVTAALADSARTPANATDGTGVTAAGAGSSSLLAQMHEADQAVSAGDKVAVAAADSGDAETGDYLDNALLHALTDALLSTGLVKPAAPHASETIGAATASIAPTAAAVAPSKRSNAEIRASIAQLRVKTGRRTQRKPGFGHLPGLQREAGVTGSKPPGVEAVCSAGGMAAAAASGAGSGLVPQASEQLHGAVVDAAAAPALDINQTGPSAQQPQEQQQQQLLDASTLQQVPATVGSFSASTAAPAMYALHLPGHQQPAYVLVPVSVLTSLQQAEQQQQQQQQPGQQQSQQRAFDQATAAIPQLKHEINRDRRRPWPVPAAGMSSLDGISGFAAAGAHSWPGSPTHHYHHRYQQQQQEEQQWPADQEMSGRVSPALDLAEPWDRERLSIPNSDWFRDSSDTFTSSITSSRAPGQGLGWHPLAAAGAGGGGGGRVAGLQQAVTVTHVGSRHTVAAPWQRGHTAPAAAAKPEHVRAGQSELSAGAVAEHVAISHIGSSQVVAALQHAEQSASAAGSGRQNSTVASSAPLTTTAPAAGLDTAFPPEVSGHYTEDSERNFEEQQQQQQGQSVISASSGSQSGSSTNSGGSGVASDVCRGIASCSVSSSSSSALAEMTYGDLGPCDQSSNLQTAAAAAPSAGAAAGAERPVDVLQDTHDKEEGVSGQGHSAKSSCEKKQGAASGSSSSSSTGNGSSASSQSQPSAAVDGGEAKAAAVGDHVAPPRSETPANQQQQQPAVADTRWPELLVLSSSSGSSGGSVSRHARQAAAAVPGDSSAAASARLWRPPREAVAAAAAAAAEQAAAALAAATAAAAAAAGNTRAFENMQQHLIRFPLPPLAASTTPAGAATRVAAAAGGGGGGTSSRAEGATGQSGLSLPSPGMSSMVEAESSTTTLTTISTNGTSSSSGSSSSSGATGSSSLDWPTLRALGIGVPASGRMTAAAAAAGGVVVGGSSMQHGSAAFMQALLSGKCGQHSVQHVGGHHTVTVTAAAQASRTSSAGDQSTSVSPGELLRRQKLRHLAQRQQQRPQSHGALNTAAAVPGWVQCQFAGANIGALASSPTGSSSKVHDSLASTGGSTSSNGSSSSEDSGDSDEYAVGLPRESDFARKPLQQQQQQQPAELAQAVIESETVGADHGSVSRSLSASASSLDRLHSVTSSMASN